MLPEVEGGVDAAACCPAEVCQFEESSYCLSVRPQSYQRWERQTRNLMLASSSRDRLQVEVPSTQGLDAIVQFTNTDKLHQKLLYLQCIPAAATSTKYDDNIDVLLPLMEELGHDEDQPEEVKLEIAAQLPALGKLSAELVLHNLVTRHE